MHKELFDDAIGEVPPSTVDVEAVIGRGRRAARLRRVANPAVAAGVAVVVVTGGIVVTLADDAPPTGIGTGPTTTSQAPSTTTTSLPTMEAPVIETPSPPAACAEPEKLEPPQQVIDRLDAAIMPLVYAHVTPIQLTASPGAYIGGVQYGPLEFYQVSGHSSELRPICEADYMMARAVTQTVDGGTGNMMILIEPSDYRRPGAGGACDGPPEVTPTQTHCEEVTGPHGEPAVETTNVSSDGGVTTYRIDVVREDGTGIIIDVENIGTTSKSGGTPTASEPPMTHAQLLAIACEPALTLFPNF